MSETLTQPLYFISTSGGLFFCQKATKSVLDCNSSAYVANVPPTASLCENAETSCTVMHVCVLGKRPNLGFGSQRWFVCVHISVCMQIHSCIWLLRSDCESRRWNKAGHFVTDYLVMYTGCTILHNVML